MRERKESPGDDDIPLSKTQGERRTAKTKAGELRKRRWPPKEKENGELFPTINGKS